MVPNTISKTSLSKESKTYFSLINNYTTFHLLQSKFPRKVESPDCCVSGRSQKHATSK